MTENYFIDNTMRRNVVTIIPPTKYNLTNSLNSVNLLEKCEMTLERVESSNMIQLRLMDLQNPCKMYISTIDSYLYDRLKSEQSLHVSFHDFIVHLTKILENCQKNDLLVSLLKTGDRFILQFYERGSFRNFIHLFLPMKEAPIETILFHINSSFNSIQDKLMSSNNQKKQLENEISSRDTHIIQLNNEMRRLNEIVAEQEKLVFNRNCEEVNQLQQTIKHLQDAKETEEKKFKMLLAQQQEQQDVLKKENLLLGERITQESLKVSTLRDEINSFKLNNTNLRDRNERIQSELITIQNREKKQEYILSENRRLIHELNEKLSHKDKRISDMEAELEAEKNICSTKRNSLQIATEEIAKANGIILKQGRQLNDLQKDIDIRTEIALKQEVLLKEKEHENDMLSTRIAQLQDEFLKAKQEHRNAAVSLRGLQDDANKIEDKYKSRIEELHRKICGNSISPLGSCNSNSSTRYMKMNSEYK